MDFGEAAMGFELGQGGAVCPRDLQVRISRDLGSDFTRSRARVSRHLGQPFHGIVGRLIDKVHRVSPLPPFKLCCLI